MARECVRCWNTEKQVRKDKLKCGAWWQARKKHLYIDVDDNYKTKHKEKRTIENLDESKKWKRKE